MFYLFEKWLIIYKVKKKFYINNHEWTFTNFIEYSLMCTNVGEMFKNVCIKYVLISSVVLNKGWERAK